jgi:hypothetical protein
MKKVSKLVNKTLIGFMKPFPFKNQLVNLDDFSIARVTNQGWSWLHDDNSALCRALNCHLLSMHASILLLNLSDNYQTQARFNTIVFSQEKSGPGGI